MKVGVVRGPNSNPTDMMTYQDASGDGVEFTFCGTHEVPNAPMLQKVYPGNSPLWITDLTATINGKHDFDILDVPDPMYQWARKCVENHPRVVVTVWENLVHNMFYPYSGTREEWQATLDKAALVVARSPLTYAALLEFGVPEKKMTLIPAAVDAERFKPMEKVRQTVLYAGRITWEKGIYDLIYASRGQRWQLILCGQGVGGGPRQVAETLGMDNVQFIEGIPHEEMPSLYGQADVFCYPSIPTALWQEQFGVAVIEAAASGCKLVLSNQAVFRWFRRSLRHVFYASPGDFLALRHRIKQAVAIDGNGALTGNQFNSQHVGKRLRDEYAKLV